MTFKRVTWAIGATGAIVLLAGCSEADVQSAASVTSNIMSTGTLSSSSGIRQSSQTITPPANAQPYGVSGTLTTQEEARLKYLDYQNGQSTQAIRSVAGAPYYAEGSADYYRLDNGRWARVDYDNNGKAYAVTRDDSSIQFRYSAAQTEQQAQPKPVNPTVGDYPQPTTGYSDPPAPNPEWLK